MLRGMRYDKSEYFWINDMHPIKPALEGKDLTGNLDKNGKAILAEFARVVKAAGAGYVDYMWSKAGSDKPAPKLSYVKGFTPWGRIVGSGVYVDDIDTQFRAESLRVGVIAALTLGLLIFVSTLISRSILRQLGAEPTYAAEASQVISSGHLTLSGKTVYDRESSQH